MVATRWYYKEVTGQRDHDRHLSNMYSGIRALLTGIAQSWSIMRSLGRTRAITVPYAADFNTHSSNLYFGASLKALCKLTVAWGYSLVGTNSAGSNAFFVKIDLLNDNVPARVLDEVFIYSKFRESRDLDGRLTFLSGAERLRAIAGLKVVNVDTNEIETL